MYNRGQKGGQVEKHWLLIAGEHYYPAQGTGNWVKVFASKEEAEEAGKKMLVAEEYSDDWAEWFKVVDLKEWILIREEV